MKHYQPAKPGTTLAGFKVLAEIGRGAASEIYLVQDPKKKQVWALKHVRRKTAKDERFIQQAESEYQIAQLVRHPLIRHIEKLIKGRGSLLSVREVFLLMEYVDGVSIELHPPATFDAALRVFIDTATGLAHMHECGYVHADIKPNNIVVDDAENVKIIDLGQACKIGTVKERIQGTPDYIAPEQVHRREITPQTDVYNLGATMYWAFTHRHVPTAISNTSNSLAGPADEETLAKPTAVHEINRRVPPSLNELILWCVEPPVKARPESMQTVANALKACRREVGDAGELPRPAQRGADAASA